MELACSICLELMNDPHMTRCGHSFCLSCIQESLIHTKKCPQCFNVVKELFPNLTLDSLIKQQRGNRALNLSPGSLLEIDQALQVLLEKKNELQDVNERLRLSLLGVFLNNTLERKSAQMEVLKSQLARLNRDLSMVESVHQVPTGKPSSNACVPRVELGKRKYDGPTSQTPRPTGYESRIKDFSPDLESTYFVGRMDESSSDLYDFSKDLYESVRYSSLKTLASIDYADGFFHHQSCLVSAIEFDKDGDLFATAGVSKKIRIFDYASLVDDIHDLDLDSLDDDTLSIARRRALVPKYPVANLNCVGKVSSLSFNASTKSMLAACDYQGIVSLWDVSAGNVVSRLQEHEKRIWSVDFSLSNPSRLASGGDDAKLKIWTTHQRQSTLTIESIANICSVNFHPTKDYIVVFGSADHLLHCYDIRYSKGPMHLFKGHRKAVSYVKFLNSDEIVSASIDSTLRSWSLTDCFSGSKVSESPVRTFSGHLNDKNFIGMAVHASGDFIACGSETNHVYTYHSKISTPIAVEPFENPVDPINVISIQSRVKS